MKLILQEPDLVSATRLTSHGFFQPESDELRKDVAKHIHGDLVYSILDDDGTYFGFATFSIDGDLIYLEGIMIDTPLQGHSIGGKVIEAARVKTKARYLALRTQSPRMWSVGYKLCDIWFPDDPQPEQHPELAVVMDRVLALKRNVDSTISLISPTAVACYGGEPLYGEKPIHHDLDLQRWWDSLCNFERGDGVVCVGRFRES
jgi:hypothetical protein